MRQVKSCGVLLFRPSPRPAFLLMRHPHRRDLPKGHTEPGEGERACVLRELEEETGLRPGDVELDDGFRYEERYQTPYRRFGGEVVDKTLVILIGRLLVERELRLTEHIGYDWIDWSPPHTIQTLTIDALLAQVADYFTAHPHRAAHLLGLGSDGTAAGNPDPTAISR